MAPDPLDRRVRVVLADDTSEIRSLVRAALDMDGRFEVVAEAEDGQQASDAVFDHQADAVVLDLAMPNVDGLEAIPMILARRPSTHILVLSAFNASQMESEALRLGAHAYVEKGTSIRTIVELLASLCSDVLGGQEATPPVRRTTHDAEGEDEVDVALSYLGHELRTPITVIKGLSATLADAADSLDPARVRDSAAAIRRSALSLERLVDAIADAHTIDAHGLDLETEATDVGALVDDAIADLARLHPEREFRHDTEGDLEARVDPVRIRQVLINLLSNAAKFSPHGTVVAVTSLGERSRVRVSVRDHGSGVPPHRAHELFERFARLGSDQKGTGLGLYISRGIAHAHGGELTYEPAEGGGSRFTLLVPRRG